MQMLENMYDHSEDIPLTQIVTVTKYCWPVTDAAELHSAASLLRSRVPTKERNPERYDITLAFTLDRYLEERGSQANGWTRPDDQTGRRVIFLHVLAPLSRDRAKQVADLDEASTGTPLLISVLYPDMAFNISEIAAAYDFSLELALEEFFGYQAMADHILVYDGTIYLDVIAIFNILNHEHPALLLPLAHSIVLRDPVRMLRVREVLRGVNEALSALENDSIVLLHQARALIIEECRAAIPDLIIYGEDDNRWYLSHVLAQAYDSLLAEEVDVFKRQYTRLTSQIDHMDIDEPQDSSIEDLERVYRLIRSVTHRLFRLRQAIPASSSD